MLVVLNKSRCLFFQDDSCLENLEMAKDFTYIREMSGISVTIKELSGKNC